MRIAKEATWPEVGKRPNFWPGQEFGHANNPSLLDPEVGQLGEYREGSQGTMLLQIRESSKHPHVR